MRVVSLPATFTLQKISLVLITVTGWVDPRGKGSGQGKIPTTPLRTESATFRLVVHWINQMLQCIHLWYVHPAVNCTQQKTKLAPVPLIRLENCANPQYFSMFHIIPNSTLMKNTFRNLIMLQSTDEDLALHLKCNSAKKGNHTLTYLQYIGWYWKHAHMLVLLNLKKYVFLKILQLTYYYVLFLLL